MTDVKAKSTSSKIEWIYLEFCHRYKAPQMIDFCKLVQLLFFDIAKLNLGKFEKFKKI